MSGSDYLMCMECLSVTRDHIPWLTHTHWGTDWHRKHCTFKGKIVNITRDELEPDHRVAQEVLTKAYEMFHRNRHTQNLSFGDCVRQATEDRDVPRQQVFKVRGTLIYLIRHLQGTDIGRRDFWHADALRFLHAVTQSPIMIDWLRTRLNPPVSSMEHVRRSMKQAVETYDKELPGYGSSND